MSIYFTLHKHVSPGDPYRANIWKIRYFIILRRFNKLVWFNLNTFAASYLNTQGLNNSCLKSPASTLVDAGDFKHELLNRLRSTMAVNVLIYPLNALTVYANSISVTTLWHVSACVRLRWLKRHVLICALDGTLKYMHVPSTPFLKTRHSAWKR